MGRWLRKVSSSKKYQISHTSFRARRIFGCCVIDQAGGIGMSCRRSGSDCTNFPSGVLWNTGTKPDPQHPPEVAAERMDAALRAALSMPPPGSAATMTIFRLTFLSNVVAYACRPSSTKDLQDVHQHRRLDRRGAIG